MNIALIPNLEKPDAVAAAQDLLDELNERGHARILSNPAGPELAAFKPDLVIVLGGDGSILSIAQEMVGMRVPVAGINFGKLGYMAAFSLVQFKESLELILAGKAPRTERLMLHGAIYRCNGDPQGIQRISDLSRLQLVAQGYALNDVVINAGDPFRMIELNVQIDEYETTTFRSDGVIVATASGSTGYNLSAGGPLVSPAVEAMVLTPICPHSLSFRPVVLACSSTVVLVPRKLNAGSKVNFDGQLTMPLTERDCVVIRRAPTPLVLVENPTVSHWQMLGQKLHWARSPR
ncbi:MAG: NAD(+)/NADH kinase [Phycisphaerae bacterium]